MHLAQEVMADNADALLFNLFFLSPRVHATSFIRYRNLDSKQKDA